MTKPILNRIVFWRKAAERGGYNMHLEGRQSLDHGIENGRGGIWLLLTEKQYGKLRNGDLTFSRALRAKAKGRLPLRDIALPSEFFEDLVRPPDHNIVLPESIPAPRTHVRVSFILP